MGTAPKVGLITATLSLARAPLRLTLRVWEFGLSSAAEVARIGVDLLDPDRGAPPPDFALHRAPAHQPDVDAASTEPEVDAPPAEPDVDAPPAVPDELIPDHIDTEPVLVAEAAEEGAQDGAGAELHVDPPWDGYDQMTAAAIRDRLAAAGATEAAAVELYEASSKNRRSVLDAAERALSS
jgi:hypothetical protein